MVSSVFRSRGASSLAEACIETVLNPQYSLGHVTVGNLDDRTPEEVREFLGLDEVSQKLCEAWVNRNYPGQLNEFVYGTTVKDAPRPHLDQKKGPGYFAPPRAVVLSIARYGIGYVRGQQLPTVIQPSDTTLDRTALNEVRQQAQQLDPSAMPIVMEHHPDQILIIPTLPSPVAHMVTRLTTDRATDTWDAALSI